MSRKRDGGTGMIEWHDVYVLLFDHYLVVCKLKKDDLASTRYHILDRPIPIEFMKVAGFDTAPEKKSRGLKSLRPNLLRNSVSINAGHWEPPSAINLSQSRHAVEIDTDPRRDSTTPSQNSRDLYPLTIQSFGSFPRTTTLYVDSERSRQAWKHKLEKAIETRLQNLKSSQVFELRPITQDNPAPSASASKDLRCSSDDVELTSQSHCSTASHPLSKNVSNFGVSFSRLSRPWLTCGQADLWFRIDSHLHYPIHISRRRQSHCDRM